MSFTFMAANHRNQWWLALYVLVYGVVMIGRIWWGEPEFINIESDNLFYDAKLVVEGAVPFRDVFTREIIPLYWYAAVISLFGPNVSALLITDGLIAVLALWIFAQITQAVFRQWPVTGCAVVVLSWFGIRGWQDLFLFCAIAAWLGWRQRQRAWYLLVSGTTIGLSILSYRAYVIWVVVLLVLFTHDWLYHNTLPHARARSYWLGYGAYCLGLAASLVLPLLGFIAVTDWRWMAESFLADKLLFMSAAAAALGPLFFLLAQRWKFTAQQFGWWPIVATTCAVVLLVVNTQPDLFTKIGVVHDFVRSTAWGVLPLLIVFVFGGWQLYGQKFKVLAGLLVGIATVAELSFIIGAWHSSRGPSVALTSAGRNYFIIVLLVWTVVLVAVALREQWQRTPLLKDWQYSLVLLPAAGLLLGNLLYSDWLPTYIRNYNVSIVLATSLVVIRLWHTGWRSATLGLFVGVVFFNSTVLSNYTTAPSGFNPATQLRNEDVAYVVAYLEKFSQPTDTIFTAVPAFAFRSGRDLALPITHPVVYISSVSDPKSYDPYGLIPSVKEIKQHLRSAKVPYIIQDERTRSLFRTDRHPELARYISRHYDVAMTYGNIKVLTLQRKNRF